MTDMSHLDAKYFIDKDVYNCPFCNRRNVAYTLQGKATFDWSSNRTCYLVIVKCQSCYKKSLHLSYEDVVTVTQYSEYLDVEGEIDDKFFYSVPTSFFVLDDRIPKILRELMSEAEGCLKGNFLTGASACARKIVYELAALNDAEGDDYTTQVKALKAVFPGVDPGYFDTLVAVKDATSSKVHEKSHDAWESKHLRLILSALKDVLDEIYVLPKIREEKQRQVQAMRKAVLGGGE